MQGKINAVDIMSYKSIIVSLQLGEPHDCLLELAGNLAVRFDARLIGVAAYQFSQPASVGDATADILGDSNEEIGKEVAQVEALFRSTFVEDKHRIDWISSACNGSVDAYLAKAARSADLLLTGSATSSIFDSQRHMNIDQLVMLAGRPVLIVPPEAISLQLDGLLVVWDDTREARRAISDALPLLAMARKVTVLHLANGADEEAAQIALRQVIAWLAIHSIAAKSLLVHPDHSDARQLQEIAAANAYDLVIAGAYGHSRLREWFSGGVTHSLLHPERYCCLLSH